MSTRTGPTQQDIDEVVRAVHPRVMAEIARGRRHHRWAVAALGLAVVAGTFSAGLVVGSAGVAHPVANSLTECVA
jgi:hypothetical protein